MGKYAQYLKRGSAAQQGNNVAPATSNFTIGTTTSTTIPVNQATTRPPGVDGFVARALLTSTGKFVAASPITSGTVATITGLVTATAYSVQIAWYSGSTQVSDYSASLPATTL